MNTEIDYKTKYLKYKKKYLDLKNVIGGNESINPLFQKEYEWKENKCKNIEIKIPGSMFRSTTIRKAKNCNELKNYNSNAYEEIENEYKKEEECQKKSCGSTNCTSCEASRIYNNNKQISTGNENKKIELAKKKWNKNEQK